ncbi:formylmethanofuran dehydrogenase [Methanoculleus sp. FWC-SCC3]|uniref:Formylmethanofuran dehydrogenase n=1 Tax=Methanoculleus methanifontis TaxID=2584086 RepID=A0ABT8M321_9EURY|nr:FmdE family protein [Methanoculleus sp. FWC-SCC3]MDN7013103.1 formylmethanofuran dehydrogenase [Methanoculleus sp. FWC-SCC3]
MQPRLNHTWEDIEARLESRGSSPELIEDFKRCIDFHTFAAPGLLVGVFMVDYAMELLDVPRGEKIYGVCESKKCLPDALQVVAHCTIGNNRLRVIPIGKFAITMNGPADAPYVNGIRVFVDGDKIERYPTFALWYTKDPLFDPRTRGIDLIDELIDAGRGLLSQERVRVKVPQKWPWKSAICSICGEMVPNHMLVDGACADCRSQSYYEKVAY